MYKKGKKKGVRIREHTHCQQKAMILVCGILLVGGNSTSLSPTLEIGVSNERDSV